MEWLARYLAALRLDNPVAALKILFDKDINGTLRLEAFIEDFMIDKARFVEFN